MKKKNFEKGYKNRYEYSIFFFLLMRCKKHHSQSIINFEFRPIKYRFSHGKRPSTPHNDDQPR